MADDPLVEVELAATLEDALAALEAAAAGVVAPAGELVAVGDFAEEITLDEQRRQLVPAALAALARSTEIWRFSGHEQGEPVEHCPHLLWCSIGGGAPELVIAGTRRIGGQLHLHTWFRYGDGSSALRRYWESGVALHPVRTLRPHLDRERDVLHLLPSPAVPYRVTRVLARPSVFAYLDARIGFPSVVGFEVQDARRHAVELAAADAPAGLLSLPCALAGGDGPQPLQTLIARLLGELAA